jgi:glyoxylase-like metal-dependent hydrolase (beta-lactamase superfamily II)
MIGLTRRAALTGATALTLAPAIPTALLAAAPASSGKAAGYYRYKVGSYEITAIYDGIWLWDLDATRVKNAPLADVQKALADAFAPAGKLPIPFTSLVINTGPKLILIDCGGGNAFAPQTAGSWRDNFTAAGFNPGQVDTVIISHFHPDHVNNLRTADGQLTFPNAEVMVPAPEWAFWMDDAKMNATPEAGRGVFMNTRRVFGSIASKVTRYEWGKEIAPGITSVGTPGHTPGHTSFAVASGNQSLMVMSDVSNNPYLFVRHPEWQIAFDMDGPLAVEGRKKMLDRVAADKMQVAAYHFPFPATGHITKVGSGYRYENASWNA